MSNNENNEKSLREAMGNIKEAAKGLGKATQQCSVLCGRQTRRKGKAAVNAISAVCRTCRNTLGGAVDRTSRFFEHGYWFLAGNNAWHRTREQRAANNAAEAAYRAQMRNEAAAAAAAPRRRVRILTPPPYSRGDMLTSMLMLPALQEYEENGYQVPAYWEPEWADYLAQWHNTVYGSYPPGLGGAAGGAPVRPPAMPLPAMQPPPAAAPEDAAEAAEVARRQAAYARTRNLNRARAEREAAEAARAQENLNARRAANLAESRAALAAFQMPGGAISFYTMLGLPQGTSTGQIRRRQLTLLRQFHPDKQLGAAGEEATKVINLAAEVLGDREKRAAYDAELVSGGSHEDGLAAAALHGGRRHKSRRASRKSKGTHRR